MPDKPTTGDVYAAIQKRFESPAWALIFEVADATGARHSRWADAVAMGLWPSRGLHMHGMEIKSSRTDWVKERKTPAKAESVCKFCDFWWLVVSDESIVKDGELPATWGLLALNGKGQLKTVKAAPALQPVPITTEFLCGLLRSASSPSDRGRAEIARKAYWNGQQKAEERLNQTIEHLTKRNDELRRTIREFESTAGFGLSVYKQAAGQRAQLIRDVVNGNYDRDDNSIAEMRRLAASIVSRIDESGVLTK